ncbi:MAG: hypothetical protein CHACPFDD_01064 [Phycisphaerae bacterium]|nr:hypothetical protein [Phycisphaerae bacterium]
MHYRHSTEQPWRCWERTTLAGVLNGPQSLLVRVALQDRRDGTYQSEFRWPALERLGPNDYQGQYAQATLRFGRVRWSFEMASAGRRVFLLVRALNEVEAGDVQIRLETLFDPPEAGQIVSRENEVVARSAELAWRIHSPTPSARRYGTTIASMLNRPFMAVIEPAADFGKRLEQRSESEPRSAGSAAPLTSEEREIASAVRAARAAYLARFSYVPRELWWMYAAIPYGLGWNLIWAADRREPVQVCSRDWCVHGNYGEWVLFNWDTFLLAPAAADFDADYAHQILRPQFSVQTADGLIPGIASPLGISADRAMPPDATLPLWKAYLRTKDRSFVEAYYESLLRYYKWWRRNRDGNNDGLLEWGSNPVEAAHPQWQAHTAWASRYETGMDNHPMWDDVLFNARTHTQEQTDVGLNALHAIEGVCLSRMADLLGQKNDAAKLAEHAELTARKLHETLWNEDVGLWLSRRWDGTWNPRASSCCFYPIFMAAARFGRKPAIPSTAVARAVSEHLRNPKRFGGKYLLPVSPRDDPAYPEQYYVRGRIWPGQALLVHTALREAGQEDAAAELARGCLATLRDEWVREGHLHENYHAETADGDDTPESDPLYSFGPMLAIAAWQHVRDVLVDGTEATAPLESLSPYLDASGALRTAIEPIEGLRPIE